MNRVGAIAAAVVLFASGIASAEPKAAPSIWNAEAARAARTAVENGLAAVERLDAEALRALCTSDIVAYDIDLESKPVRMGSLDDAIAYVAAVSAGAKQIGATVRFENVKTDCRATSDLAFCLLEYDFAATMPDGSRAVQPSQTTVVLAKSGGAWKWAHWHTSLSAPATTAGAPK
jgi:ketosteroid isomerase-like protein